MANSPFRRNQLVNEFDRSIKAVLQSAGEKSEWTSLRSQFGNESFVHPFAYQFAVTRAVLNERRVDVGQQINVRTAMCGGDGFDFRRTSAHVSKMPDAGGESVRVANQRFTRAPRRFILAFALCFGDEREFLRTPVIFATLRQFAFGVFAAILGNPYGPVSLSQHLRQRGLASRFRADQTNSFHIPGAYGRLEKIPVS